MKFLNRLKTERQDLINSLNDNIEALEELAFEQQAEIDNLQHYKQSYEELKAEHLELIRSIKTCQIEAIKEFESKVIEKAYADDYFDMVVNVASIEAIAKEMVGEDTNVPAKSKNDFKE